MCNYTLFTRTVNHYIYIACDNLNDTRFVIPIIRATFIKQSSSINYPISSSRKRSFQPPFLAKL